MFQNATFEIRPLCHKPWDLNISDEILKSSIFRVLCGQYYVVFIN